VATTRKRLERSSRPGSPAYIAFTTLLITVAIVAFLVGRTAATTPMERESVVRPVHLTASLQSVDGARRAAVMRKMNSLAGP
jgi:hypothetical protein